MNKAYLLAICLLLTSFIGCIEDSNNLEKTSSTDEENTNDNEEDTIEPVGEGNLSSLEKRVSELEATIAEYELPKVYFLNMNQSGYTFVGYSGYEFQRSDDGYLNCYYQEYYERNSCTLNALYYDVNGMIESYSWKGSKVEIENIGLCQENTDPLICLMVGGGTGWISQDVCGLSAVNQTLTLTVYDNDGNEASASYDLDYWSNCGSTYEPELVPEISFFVEETSNGTYHIEVITVSEQYDLSDFSFFLKDGSGSTYTAGSNGFGEIAMTTVCGQNEYGQIDCNMSNLVTGIDETYNENDYRILLRLYNMTADDGAEFPVRFFDNDGDDMLSVGDKFIVYGSGSGFNGPAEDGWKLEIRFDISGDVAGYATLL